MIYAVFEVPSYEPVKKDNPSDFDPYMSAVI